MSTEMELSLPVAGDGRVLNIVQSHIRNTNITKTKSREIHGGCYGTVEFYVDVDKTEFYLNEEPQFRSYRVTGPDAPVHYHIWTENNLVAHEWCKKCGKVRERP